MPQNPRDSLFGPDDPFSASAQAQSAQSAVSATDSLFASDETADRALASTLRQQANGDAARAERILKLQGTTGLPAAVIDRNLDDIEKKAAAQDFNAEKLRAETPALASWLQEEPQRASLKQDDLAHLGALEFLKTAPAAAFQRSVDAEHYASLRFKSWFTPLSLDEQTAMKNFKTGSEMPIGDDTWWRKIYSGLPSFLGQQVPTAKGAVVGGGIGATTGLVTAAALGPGAVVGGVTVPGMAIGGAAVGATYGMATSTFQQESVGAYDELEQMGIDAHDPIDPRVLQGVALGVGAINTAIELEAQGYVFSKIPGVRNLTNRWAMNKAKEALANPSKRAAIAAIVAKYGKGLAVEVGQEVAQELVKVGFQETAKIGTDVPNKSVGDVASQAAQTALDATAEFALFSGIGPGMQGVKDYRQARAGEQLLDNIGSVTKDAKILKNLPRESQAFLARADAFGTDKVYAPLSVWNEYWHKQGQDPAQVATDLTGSSQAYDDATTTTNEVAIPTANWAVRAAPEHSDFWRSELRYGENKMNAREANEWLDELRAQRDAEIEAGTAAPIAPDVQGRLAEGMAAQLQAAGRDQEEAHTQGHIFASQIMALSMRYGIDPEAMASRYMGNVTGQAEATAAPAGTAQGPVLNQAEAARATTQTPEFQHWFGESKAVDEQGQPQVVHHGAATGQFETFDASKQGATDAGYLGAGFYFDQSPRVAQVYAGEQGTVMPVYLSLQNPLVLKAQIEDRREVDREIVVRQALGLPATATSQEVTDAAKAQGYDGVIYSDPYGSREFVAFDPTQIKSATGNQGTFDPNSPNILHQAAKKEKKPKPEKPDPLDVGPAEIKDGALLVSTRAPSTAATTPIADVLLITNLAALNAAGPEKVAQAAAAFRSYQLLTPEQRAETDDNVLLRSAVDVMKRNLRALWDRYPAEWRERAKLWYVGANRIANEFAIQYGISVDAASGVLAALSPQMDWFRNVSLAEKAISIVKQLDVDNPTFTQEYFDKFKERADVATETWIRQKIKKKGQPVTKKVRAREAKYRAGRAVAEAKVRALVGQAWGDMDVKSQARFVRMHDEMTDTSREYQVISPEGDRVGPVRNKATVDKETGKVTPGKKGKVAWGTYKFIENAISILHNDSPENIHKRLGNEHKVRSFFNNISHPWDDRSVTIDTHAVAAAFLEAFAGAAREVNHTMGNTPKGDQFGPPSHAPTGISGTNAVVAQAYFELAEQLSRELSAEQGREVVVLPREVQSVTWEAVRSLFRPEQKRSAQGRELVAKIAEVVGQYHAGDISYDDYVDTIVAAAGGLETPAWADVPSTDEGRVAAGRVLPRQPDVPAARGSNRVDTGQPAGGDTDQQRRTLRGRGAAAEQAAQVSPEGGRLAQGAAPPQTDYQALTDKLLADGGFTYAPLEGVYRTEGMALSLFPERGLVFDASEASATKLAEFIEANQDLFDQPGNHFGGWYDKDDSGKIFLDVSRIVASRDEAQELGRQNEQIAFFDLNTFETVPVEYPEGHVHGPTWQGATTPATGGSADAGATGGNVEGVDGEGSDTGGLGAGAGDPGTSRLAQGERGFIEWGADRRFNINLLKDADATTFLHELGHFSFEVMGDLVDNLATRAPADLTAPQHQLIADYRTLLKFVGAESRDQVGVEHHEKLARGFEAYIMEGKAPTQELRGAFARLRAMFLQVYQTLTNLNVELSDDVRRVFDRMLASDEAIAAAEAERGIRPTFLTAKQAGMDAATWALYEDRIAETSRVAREELDQQLLVEVKREQSALYAKREAEVRAEVEATVHAQPVYRAIAAMQTGLEPGQSAAEGETPKPLKLSKDIIVERYGAARLKTLPRPYIYTKTGGMDPDAVAEYYGFSSGDDLLTQVASVPKMQEAIDQQVQARMHAESGSILTDATLEPRAQAAVANEHRAEVIRLELRALFDLRKQAAGEVALERKERDYERRWLEAEAQLRIKIAESRQQGITAAVRAEKNAEIDALEKEVSRLKGQARRGAARINQAVPDQETMREAARQRLAGTVIGDIRPQVFWNAALRAGREATEFAARQQFDPFQATRTDPKTQQPVTTNYDGAIKAKTQQLLNLTLYRQAIAMQAEVEKDARFARSLASGPARAQLGKAGHTYLDQADGINDQYEFARVSQTVLDRRASFEKWLAALEGQGLPVPTDLPTDLLEARGRRNYRTLTFDEFKGVTDGLKAIVHLAKLKNKLLQVQKQKSFDASRDDLVGGIRAHGTAKALPAEPTKYEKTMTAAAWAFAQLKRMSAIAQAMDGYVDGGTVWSYFVQPMNERQAWKEDRNREAGGKLTEIENRFYSAKEQGRFGQRLSIQAIGTSLSKDARLAVALNWGNEGGRDRLTTVPDTDPNRSWSRAQVEAILDTLDERDWKYVQAVWDYIDTYWSEIADKQERVTGVRPEKVEAVPVLTKFGTFPGGYYPLKYDPEHSDKGTSHAKADEAMSLLQASYTANTTRRGHTKERAEHVGRAVRLDRGVLYEHIGQVIHDLAFHEVLSDVQRLLRDPEVTRAIKETQGKSVVDEFNFWLEDIATDTLGGGGRSGFMEKAAQFAKTRTQIQGLAFNLWTALQQPFGVLNGAARIGPYWIMHGMNRWFRDTATLQSTVQFVYDKSAVMRNRMDNGPELADLRAKLAVRGGWFDNAVRAVTGDRLTQTALLDSFTWHIGQAQRLADMPTWLGQYAKSLHAGETEARAIAIADQAVLDSQGGGAIKDMSRVERGHPAVRAFMLFYSYGNMMLNATTRAVGKTDFKSPVQVLEFMGQLGLLYVVPSLVQVLLAQATGKDKPDDDEPWLVWLLEQTAKVSLAQAMNTVPILREAQGLVLRAEGNARYGGPAFTRIVKQSYDLGNQVAQGDLDAALFKTFTGVAGFMAGIPTAPAQKFFDGAVALSEGRTHNPLVLIFGAPKE